MRFFRALFIVLFLSCGTFFVTSKVFSRQPKKPLKPLALIYFGPGSCAQWEATSGCSEALRDIAVKAGFDFQFVTPTEPIPQDSFNRAQLWLQPGGRARIQAETMPSALKQRIVKFVKEGGGYVGFCAGAFLATESFGWMTENEKKEKVPFEAKGLGFFPGKSWYYNDFDEQLTEELTAQIIPTVWNDQPRTVYWELGPYFLPESYKSSQVLAYYLNADGIANSKKAMTMVGNFGKGKVAITAVHPEAPKSWPDYFNLTDADGEDFDLAAELMLWAQANSQSKPQRMK